MRVLRHRSRSNHNRALGSSRDRALAIAFLDVQIAEHGRSLSTPARRSRRRAIFSTIALMPRPFAPIADNADAAIAHGGCAFSGRAALIHDRYAGRWRLKCLRECDGAGRLFRDGVVRWIAVESIDDVRARH